MNTKKTIAVIGTGIMGHGIALNFLQKEYPVIVWNRSKDKAEDLLNAGAKFATSPKDATEQADIVFEVTANDASSKSVWYGDNGILAGAKPTTFLIASATLSIPWIDELAKICEAKKLQFFDMPMTGGRQGAETGKLIFLIGGDEQKLQEIKEDISAVSIQQIYFGKAGSGMRYKLLLNMLQAIHIQGLGEALHIAEKEGLDIKKVGDALAERPGGTTTNLAWRDYQTEPNPINFSIDWITKDLTYAKELAETVDTPLLNNVLKKYQQAVKEKKGTKDWTAINHR